MSSTPPPGREPYEPGQQPSDAGATPLPERPEGSGEFPQQDDGGTPAQPSGPGYTGGGPAPTGGPGATGAPYQGVPYQGPAAPTGATDHGGGYGQGQNQPQYGQGQYGQGPGQPQYGQSQYGQGQHQGEPYRGTPYGGGYQGSSYGAGQGPRNGMGLAALVVAVISLVIAWVPFLGLLGGLGGLVAVVLGAVALGRANRGEATNRGTAIAGIVIGVIAILLAIASTIFGSFLLSEVFGPQFQACMQQYSGDPTAMQRCLETMG